MAKVILTSKFSAMKSVLPVLASVLIFASCSTAYKSGQTPDDVYYSPERPKEYVRTEKKDDRRNYDEGESRDDRYIRMKIRDRRYATLYDDYGSYNPYYYHYYNSSLYYNSPWNSVSYWNYYYNPGCTPCYSCGSYPTKVVTRTPRTFDLSVYNSPNTKTVKGINVKGGSGYTSSQGNTSRNYGSGRTNTNNYGNSGRNAGDFVRETFGGGNNSSSSSKGSTSSGSSSSSSSSSGGRSSGSSSNAGARKF